MEVCRLCLDLIAAQGEAKLLDGEARDMVQVVAPELNLDVSDDPLACGECTESLAALFEFKSRCFEHEAEVREKVGERRGELTLRDALAGEAGGGGDRLEEPGGSRPKAKDRLCRTCLAPIECESFTVLQPSEPDAYLSSMLDMCLVEVDLELTKDPVMCENCLENLQKLHHFKSSCQDVEDKIVEYCETHKVKEGDTIELHKVLESEMAMPDVEMALVKKEPDEAGTSGAKVKTEKESDGGDASQGDEDMSDADDELKQEEIDIKSEAGTSDSDKNRKQSSIGQPQLTQNEPLPPHNPSNNHWRHFNYNIPSIQAQNVQTVGRNWQNPLVNQLIPPNPQIYNLPHNFWLRPRLPAMPQQQWRREHCQVYNVPNRFMQANFRRPNIFENGPRRANLQAYNYNVSHSYFQRGLSRENTQGFYYPNSSILGNTLANLNPYPNYTPHNYILPHQQQQQFVRMQNPQQFNNLLNHNVMLPYIKPENAVINNSSDKNYNEVWLEQPKEQNFKTEDTSEQLPDEQNMKKDDAPKDAVRPKLDEIKDLEKNLQIIHHYWPRVKQSPKPEMGIPVYHWLYNTPKAPKPEKEVYDWPELEKYKTLKIGIDGQPVTVGKTKTKHLYVYKCERCEFETPKPDVFVLHRGKKHLKCCTCGYVTACKKGFKEHKRTEHYVLKVKKCKFCDFVSKGKSSMRLHMRTVHRQKKYICDICSVKGRKHTSVSRESITTHLVNLHKKKKCSLCDYESRRAFYIVRHHRCRHLAGVGEVFECDSCEFETKVEAEYRRHKRKMHDENSMLQGVPV